jgi:threonyl-tRNA synthetase
MMISITFLDGSKREYPLGVSGLDVANSISKSLAKDAIAMELNGVQRDLSHKIDTDSSLKIITINDPDALEIIRHDAAHIMAQAVKSLFPDVQITIGPAIKDGFYYDFAKSVPLSEDDLQKIEVKMQEIVKNDYPFIREEWERDVAIEFFKSIGEHYKAEIIASIPAGEKISLYRQGDFIDLCRGPHSPSTSKIKHFKLMKVAGAYWRGDSKNEMLQRIYGTAWTTKEALDTYIHNLAEAEKRDHRKLGKSLELFHIQDEAQGMPFWHHNGYVIYRTIENYIRHKLNMHDYIEVKTPMMVDKKLWKASGHWEKFREDMFTVESNDKTYALKPMNCPCHVQIFKQGTKSYRDLPIRMAEFGSCHRNESSGALHGLLRVRNFVQDDAHIFCMEEQINSETVEFCKLLKKVYLDFGFVDIKVKFSDRPKVRAGTDEVWDKAENSLKSAVDVAGLEYVMNPGEGAFYGPKLEFVLTDAVGREWQCGTLQVDFVLPDRLGAEYIAADGTKKHPVMLHRAIIGTFERFMGILIENYAGQFPLWLAPIQVVVIGITNEVDDYVTEVHEYLKRKGIRSKLDISQEKVNYKIRYFSNQKTPIIVVVGEKEKKEKTLSIRYLGSNEQVVMTAEQIAQSIIDETKVYFN